MSEGVQQGSQATIRLNGGNAADPEDPYTLLDEGRRLGLTVCRGNTVMMICPVDGMEAIENPFLQAEAE